MKSPRADGFATHGCQKLRLPVTTGGLTVTSQVFAVANSTADIFEQTPADGLMGMAFSTIAEDKAPTFVENLITQNQLSANLFSVYLQRAYDIVPNSAGGYLTGGELCLGCIDSSKYTGAIGYAPVTFEAFWEVQLQGMAINGTVVAGTSALAAIDTGTSLFYLPTKAAAAFYAALGARQVQGSGGYYAVPCDIPNFTVGVRS